jgi:putative MATE family efflux protein
MIKALKDKQFLKRFFHITFPVMVQTIVSFIVTFLDNIMVGGVSNEAVSAVYAVNQISFLFFVVAYGLFSGAAVYVQQFFGAKDIKHLRQAVVYKLTVGTVFLAITLPLFYLFGSQIVAFYSRADANQAAILAEAARYLPILLLSYIPLIYATVYASTLRETARTRLPMLVGILALAVNGSLNALFIYGLNLGVVGAAIATVIARLVEATTIIFVAHRKKMDFCHNLFKEFKIEPRLFKLITLKMLPLLANEFLWSTGMIMLSLSYAQRDNVLSALSILSTTTEIFGIVFSGLAVGISVMIGSTLGAGEVDHAKDISRKLMWLGVLISLSVGGLMVALSPFIPLLWVKVESGQQTLATQMIIVYGAFLWIYSICVSTYHILRAGGRAGLTMVMDSGLMWAASVPLAWILALYTTLPLVPLYIILQSIDIVKMCLGLLLVKYGKWANNLTLQVQEPVLISDVNDLLK